MLCTYREIEVTLLFISRSKVLQFLETSWRKINAVSLITVGIVPISHFTVSLPLQQDDLMLISLGMMEQTPLRVMLCGRQTCSEHLLGAGQEEHVCMCGQGVQGKVISVLLMQRINTMPYVPQCSSLNSHLQQTSKKKKVNVLTKWFASRSKCCNYLQAHNLKCAHQGSLLFYMSLKLTECAFSFAELCHSSER